jgi:dTDP-4-dehydrorhamnose reductase
LRTDLNIPLLLYISTAGIFDGKKDLYDDWDMPNPLSGFTRGLNIWVKGMLCENAESIFSL